MAQKTDFNANGVVLWEGLSEIDGSPIVLIVTGLEKASANSKTGDLVQTWILRSDMSPREAVNAGKDVAICGTCPHKGTWNPILAKYEDRVCYVLIDNAPRQIFVAYSGGRYEIVTLAAGAEILRGRKVRLGAYGDPAAVPFYVWESLLAYVTQGTGYSHAWRYCDARLSQWCMASADNAQEGEEARARGWRSFRVGTYAESLIRGTEFLCPASEQAGRKLNCAKCLACGGNELSPHKSSVFIPVHGGKGMVNAFNRKGDATQP